MSYIFGLLILIILLIILVFIILYFIEKNNLRKNIEKYGEDIFLNSTIGIIILDDNKKISWFNDMSFKYIPYLKKGMSYEELFLEKENRRFEMKIEDKYYLFEVKENIIEIYNISESKIIEEKYNLEKPVVGVLTIDNYHEIYSSIDEMKKIEIKQDHTQILTNFFNEYNIFNNKISSNVYTLQFTIEDYQKLKENEFMILNSFRENQKEINFTISLGFAFNFKDIKSTGIQAEKANELAQSRGGDQIVVFEKGEEPYYFGAITEAFEKRSRVRSRLIASLLEQSLNESDNVYLMGHKKTDADSFGSIIGLSELAEKYNCNSKIILDENDVTKDVKESLDAIKLNNIVSPLYFEDEIEVKNDLLIICDTQNIDLLPTKKVLSLFKNIIVIDHHRTPANTISNAKIVYSEPYASSTVELVVELIIYISNNIKLKPEIANIMYKGLLVDTNNFKNKVGVRTFDAASFLKESGTDIKLVNQELALDINEYIHKQKIINQLIIKNNYAKIDLNQEEDIPEELIAMVANEILLLKGIEIVLIISNNKNKIKFTMRTKEKYNSQMLMELIGGGGHLTSAAAQIDSDQLEKSLSIVESNIR